MKMYLILGLNISTPNITGHEEWDSMDERDHMENHFVPSPANLNPLAEPFIPMLSDLDMEDMDIQEQSPNLLEMCHSMILMTRSHCLLD